MLDNGALLQMALERHCWKVAGNRIQRTGVKMQAGSILQKTDQNSPAVLVDYNIFALPVKPKKSVFLAHHRPPQAHYRSVSWMSDKQGLDQHW